MNNSQPKIVYNEECIDLRSNFEKNTHNPTNKNFDLNPYEKEWNSRPRTKQERNEVVNTALRKLAKSYNSNYTPFEKKVKTRLREHSLYDPYRKKFSDSQDSNSLKSKSDLRELSKNNSKNNKTVSSSPIIQSSYETGDFKKKVEPFKNKFTMTKMNSEKNEEKPKDGKNLIRNNSIDKLIHKFTMLEQFPLIQNGNYPLWKDRRLSEKYSLLKLPWKRSYTQPIFSQPSILLKEEYKKKLIDNSERKTYFYDDGSEDDTTYFETKQPQNFSQIFQNQMLMILNISAYICAIMVLSLVVWVISGNKYFYKWLIPKPPEDPLKKYIKFVGGSIIYALTSIVRFIGRIFAIPTQQVYHPTVEYQWPPRH